MYSLVSPSVLAGDLLRGPGGIALIDVLERGLRLDAGDLDVLAAAYGDVSDPGEAADLAAARRAAAAFGEGQPRATAALGAVAVALEGAAERGFAEVEAAGEVLATAPICTLADLLRFVRDDVLSWSRRAAGDLVIQDQPAGVQAVLDAVRAAYATAALTPEQVDLLRRPWSALVGELPSIGDPGPHAFGPQTAAVRRYVDALARLSLPELRQLDAAAWAVGARGPAWATRMHAASWAAHLSDRLVPTAAAHLAATRALLLTGVTPMLGASGVLLGAAGATQALVLADLLDADTCASLLAPIEAVLGPLLG